MIIGAWVFCLYAEFGNIVLNTTILLTFSFFFEACFHAYTNCLENLLEALSLRSHVPGSVDALRNVRFESLCSKCSFVLLSYTQAYAPQC